MGANGLNHILSDNEGYGDYEVVIASQANASGTKKLILVTEVSVSGVSSYFKILRDNKYRMSSSVFEGARKMYNSIV
jgi:hypothetical protein